MLKCELHTAALKKLFRIILTAIILLFPLTSYSYQVTSATWTGGSVTGIAYNTAGLPTGFSYSNGKNTSITYNTRNLLTRIQASTAYDTTFGYDSRGNTSTITDNLPVTTVLTHKIDPSKGSVQTTYYHYSSTYNRMTSLSGEETASYDYNNRGDMTSLKEDGVTTYTPVYDLLHNLTAYKQGSTTIAAYGYDGDELRVTKTVGGVTTVYHHDKSGKLLSETDANGNRIAAYVYVNGNMAAKVEASGVSYYHADPAGTPVAITDSTGALVWRAEYLPFGEEQLLVNTKVNDKMFVGKEKDEETGLYYFGARYMQDRNARFVSVDSVGPVDPASSKTNDKMLLNPQKLNRYSYAINNPYRYVDPDGNTVWDIADIGFFAYSSAKFAKEPSWENAGYLALDGVGLLPLIPALGTIARAAKGAEKVAEVVEGGAVIGKMQDLRRAGSLRDGEHILDLPNLGNPKANWTQNSSRLREAMSKGNPIRDASVNNITGALENNTGFLRAERNLLSDKGWKYESKTKYWNPPTK